ncbi:NADH:flavin oxidoreductase/NADH oxidase family protein [Aspergillus japonicus CBS 114.51]|uniref:NADH:flavin oxidoreductase/NADH oxidase family protein n=2 Tax=Aspergillus TaxID=5052 RepID=A0A2V5GVF0_ASPV1|nr:NADH:flavin oxidoreductase/NADH oxidase family protein [Aspergillus japonicus CBS 114.51]PYI15198.1 NADH:flavin oxidoreductase/NADH oxidase family protein [Aspergillus violaceofuscus CBS 115571]RAH77317.1 NADH:flavin oxidoreductase/NADH oxidase family protein [Aspergillus japonicus CBS 114.51]
MATTTKLFQPLQVGNMQLAHRLAMAPMTRFRADDAHVPMDMVAEHYAQRAAVPGTLLITEATLISPRAGSYRNVPGIWTEAQIAQWRKVTDAVHARGSYIYMQLWALGRVADPAALKEDTNGEFEVASASAIPAAPDAPTPRALTEAEIRAFIGEYAQAARNAIAAGFDGVEIHGANGYLIDQFNQDTANQRTDAWGGSVENRARFALEVIQAVVEAVGAERTAIRYSPFSTFQGMRMQDPRPQFRYLAEKTAEFKLSYVHVVEPRIQGNTEGECGNEDSLDFFFQAYGHAGPVITAGGFDADSAKKAVDVDYKDYDVVVGIGRPWTANPELPFKIQRGIPLRPYQREVFYLPKDPKGYNDYEYSEEFKAAKVAKVAA